MLIAFEGISRPIALIGCAHLRTCLADALPGWRCEAAPPTDADPIIRIFYRQGQGYRLESPWLAEPFHDDTEVGIVCAFILDLIAAYVGERPLLFCLHCAAAEFAGRLVIFPNSYRAGKSSLAAGLAAAGVPVFTDDVLPLTCSGDRGVALGIAPRLRLPLPRGAGRQLRSFVARHRGPSNGRYLYLNLPPRILAPHGRQAPVGGFVLLDRRRDGGADLAPASRGQVLQRVIMQHFARAFAASEIVDRLRGLIERVPCFSLRYARLDDAVAVLRERFAEWPALTPSQEVRALDRRPAPPQPSAAARLRGGPATRSACAVSPTARGRPARPRRRSLPGRPSRPVDLPPQPRGRGPLASAAGALDRGAGGRGASGGLPRHGSGADRERRGEPARRSAGQRPDRRARRPWRRRFGSGPDALGAGGLTCALWLPRPCSPASS